MQHLNILELGRQFKYIHSSTLFYMCVDYDLVLQPHLICATGMEPEDKPAMEKDGGVETGLLSDEMLTSVQIVRDTKGIACETRHG